MNQLSKFIPADNEFAVISNIAKHAQSSGLYGGVGGESKILMILLAARELGIPPMQALNGGIWNIQGKIEVSARLMSTMVRRAGHSIKIKECNNMICILEGKRCDNGDSFTSEFSWDDAGKAGLTGRDVWKKYTQDMLYARAFSRLARRLFSDVIGTAYVEGEITDKPNFKPEKAPEMELVETEEIKPIESIIEIKTEDPKISQQQLVSLLELLEGDSDYMQQILDYRKISNLSELLAKNFRGTYNSCFKRYTERQKEYAEYDETPMEMAL